MPLFIRNDSQPTAIVGCGNIYPSIEFVNNALLVDESDTTLLWHLRAQQYEEIADDDARREWILHEGWSRQSQRDYARHPVSPVPEE